MKRNTLFYMAAIVIYILMATVSWGTTWYVNPVTGNDSEQNPSYNDPLRTISEAISRAASSGDAIRLFSGDFAKEGFKEVPFGGTRYIYIDVDKSLTIERVSSSFDPRIVGYYNTMSGNDSLYNSYIMHLRASNISIRFIKFDGYNFYYHQGYGGYFNPDSLDVGLPHHTTLGITSNAQNASIEGCEFKHMGRSIEPNSDDAEWENQAIIGAHPYGGDYSTISGIEIIYNTFIDNPIDTSHGHEIYFTSCLNSEISGNKIYNNGMGVPIRFSNGCNSILIEDNYVLGAPYRGFVHDWKNEGASLSSNIRLINNVFSDSTGVYGSAMCTQPGYGESEYKGPFTPNTLMTIPDEAFITEFSNNIIGYLPGSDNHNVHGVYADSDGIFIASYNNFYGGNHDYVHYLPKHTGPMFMPRDGETYYNYLCYGDLCTTSDYIFTAGTNSGQFSVYKVPKKDGANESYEKSEIRVNSTMPITAMASSNLANKFLTAVRDDNKAKLFLSTETDIDNYTVWECAGIDSITAMATSYSTVAFVGYKDGISKFYHFTLSSSPPYVSDIDSTNSYNYYIPAMTFFENDLICARELNNITQLFKGSTSSPFSTFLKETSSSSIKVISMSGYNTGSDIYLYTVIYDTSDSSNAINKKLFFNNDEYEPFGDVIFFSHWWGEVYEH